MHGDREQRHLLGVGKLSSSLFWFLWLPGSMLLDENWTSWAVSERFSRVVYQEATEYKLKQALVGANQLNRLMIPVRRCEIIYPLNTQAWQVSVFWVTDLMSTVCFWLSVLHCDGRTWTVWSVWFSGMVLSIMLLRVILLLCFLHHKQRRIKPIILVSQLNVTVAVEIPTLRLMVIAVFWGAGRDGDVRWEGPVRRWGEARNGIAPYS